MKSINMGLKLAVLAVAAVMVLVSSQAAQAETFEIKAISAWPPTVYEVQNFTKFLDILKKNIAAKAPGELKIRYLGGPEVIPNREQVEALRNGSVDMVFTTSGYYVSVVPVIDAMNITEYQPWEEREMGVNAFLDKIHNQKVNAHYLGRLGIGIPFMLFLNKPIKGLDLNGLKIRCSPTHIECLKALGAQPVVIPPPDVYAALERGVVDGLVWVAGLIRDWGWHEVVKYRVEPGFYNGVNIVLINKDVWDGLPDKLKKIIEESEIEAEKTAVARGNDHVAKENAAMEKTGQKAIKLSDADAAKLHQVARDSLAAVSIKKAGDDAKKLIEMITK
jgi:TRAP-type C4-dicarboxylate transport system substrate-binding protein